MDTKTAIASLALASAAWGAAAEDLPRVVGEMRHVMITMDNGRIGAHVEGEPVELLAFREDSYTGAASVLDGSFYSSQYGWLAGGFIPLGVGESIVIENTSTTDGLRAYEGGMRMMRETHTYDPIFGTDGSSATSTWAGTMRHDWFAADDAGRYEALFRLSVIDETGAEVLSYGDAEVTLSFIAMPSPAGAALIGLGLIAAPRRRR